MNYVALARGRYLKICPRKSRLVADLIRGKDAGEAITILKFSKKRKNADEISKVLNSAIANAQVKFPTVDVDKLFISKIFVDKAQYLKRFRTAPRGRGMKILKKYSHVTVYLDEMKEK